MRIEHKHNKTKDEAYKIIDKFLGELKEKYKDNVQNYSKNWNYSKDIMEFSLYVRGLEISGKIQLYDNLIVLEGKLPFLVRIYQEKIESMIRQKLKEILS
jgi:hypothetical protein